jgi:hypothetical protein
MTITIEVNALDERAAVEFVDAFNEWARHPDIDALMFRTDDTPTGAAESDYRITGLTMFA